MKIILYTTTELNLIKDIIDNVEKYQVNEVGEIKENLRFVENYKEFTICFNEDKKYYIAVEKNKASNENSAKETSEVNESVYSQDFSGILKLLYKNILNISRRTKISVLIIFILILSNILLYNEYFNYNSRGFNKHNIHRVTKTNYDEEGYDVNGRDKNSYNRDGFAKDGYNEKGFDVMGYDRKGYNKMGYNRDGYNREGYNKEGYNLAGYNKDRTEKVVYYESGELMARGHYRNGIEDGMFEQYYKNGVVGWRGTFSNGKQTGYWYSYYEDGSKMDEGFFGY